MELTAVFLAKSWYSIIMMSHLSEILHMFRDTPRTKCWEHWLTSWGKSLMGENIKGLLVLDGWWWDVVYKLLCSAGCNLQSHPVRVLPLKLHATSIYAYILHCGKEKPLITPVVMNLLLLCGHLQNGLVWWYYLPLCPSCWKENIQITHKLKQALGN